GVGDQLNYDKLKDKLLAYSDYAFDGFVRRPDSSTISEPVFSKRPVTDGDQDKTDLSADTLPAGLFPGSDVPYVKQSFDDSSWRKLNLPHDWGIEGPFKQEYPGDTGKLPWWGIAWYRKHFNVDEAD